MALEERKQALVKIVDPTITVRLSEHFPERGMALFEAAKQQGLEGILAKHRGSLYEERRSREWLKIKITQTVDCVIGGYTDPEGSRQYFGSIVLGLVRRAWAVDSCRPGGDRLQSGDVERNLADTQASGEPNGRLFTGRWRRPMCIG